MRVLITGDSLQKLKVATDTSLRIAHELIKRGHSVDWCDFFENPLPSMKNLKISTFGEINLTWAPTPKTHSTAKATDYAIIFHRKDPPVDDAYKKFHEAFLKVPSNVWQINHPKALLEYREHTLPKMFPAESLLTQEVHSIEEVEKCFNEWGKKIVVKLENEGRGIGIRFILSDADFYGFSREKPIFPRVVQPFVPGVPEDGDLRVLCFRGTIIGYFARIPQDGSLLANFYQGASAVYRDLTTKEKAAAVKISLELVKKGIDFTGLDFLGGKISEINFTSPTGFAQYETLTQKKPAVAFVDAIERELATIVKRAVKRLK